MAQNDLWQYMTGILTRKMVKKLLNIKELFELNVKFMFFVNQDSSQPKISCNSFIFNVFYIC